MKTKLLMYTLIFLMLGQLTVVNAQEVDIPDDSVWSLAWSPDSTHIAAARYNGTVEIQSALTGLVEKTLQSGFTSQITAVAWSPDGTRIAGSNELKAVFLWDANTGLLIRTLQGQITDHITNLAWSSDSTFIAGVSQFDGKLQIWNADTGELSINVWHGYLEGLDWINDKIVTASGNGIGELNAVTGEFVKHIGFQNVYIDSVAWSPDGNRVVSGGMDGVVRIWDANASQEILVLSGHTLPVPSVDWSPDGSSVVSASLDGTVLIWNSTTGQLIKTIQVGAPLLSVKFSPNGNQLAYSGDVVGVGETVTIIPSPTTSAPILFASSRDGSWELYTMQPDGSGVTRLTTNAATDTAPAWSPDRSQIAFTSNRDGNFEIYTMNADSSNLARLTKPLPIMASQVKLRHAPLSAERMTSLRQYQHRYHNKR